MSSNRLAFAAVSLACVVAAGGGAYLATRQSQASSAIAAPAPAAEATSIAPAAPETTPAPAPIPVSPAMPPAAPVAARAALSPAPAPAKKTSAPVAPKHTAPPDRLIAQAQPPAPAPFIPPPPDVAPQAAPAAPEPPRQDDVRPPEPPRAIEPDSAPEKTFDELVVSADSVIGLQLDAALSSDRAKVEDRVEARVVRDVRVGSGNHVAIPAGAKAVGTVTVVDKGGKLKDRARLGIKFNSIVLPDGTRVPINTEVIYRYGDPPATAQKIGGGAVIGAIVGGIFGGAKGAAIGAGAGAGGGAAAAAAGDRSTAEFPAGIQVTARFLSPVTITVEH